MWAHWLIYLIYLVPLTLSCQVFKLANKDVQIFYTDTFKVSLENFEKCIEKCKDDNTCVATAELQDARCVMVKLEPKQTPALYNLIDDAETWVKLPMVTPEIPARINCSDWMGFSQTAVGCYALGSFGVTWDEAEANCQALGPYFGVVMHLAEIDSFEEMLTLAKLMEDKSMFNSWIGASDAKQDDLIQFTTSGNQVPADLWFSSAEPNHESGDCVILNMLTRHLHVKDCNNPWYGFICEVSL